MHNAGAGSFPSPSFRKTNHIITSRRWRPGLDAVVAAALSAGTMSTDGAPLDAIAAKASRHIFC